jgi:hypothetical protein
VARVSRRRSRDRNDYAGLCTIAIHVVQLLLILLLAVAVYYWQTEGLTLGLRVTAVDQVLALMIASYQIVT